MGNDQAQHILEVGTGGVSWTPGEQTLTATVPRLTSTSPLPAGTKPWGPQRSVRGTGGRGVAAVGGRGCV